MSIERRRSRRAVAQPCAFRTGPIDTINQITPRLERGVALLRAAGFALDDIADALLAEGAALAAVVHGKKGALARLTAMAAFIEKRSI